MQKYRLTRELAQLRVPALQLEIPPAATDDQLLLAHQPDYFRRVVEGTLNAKEQREIGFPWSAGMVERSRRSVGATISACRSALEIGVAVNLAGGTHHAHADRGSGFCVFNDVVVAARVMQLERRVKSVAIIDLDVHQGNGTAAMTRDDASIFTMSIHGASNFPFRKEQSDLDIALKDGTGDEEYLACLQDGLAEVCRRFCPEMVIYLAGADPYHGDRLGRLALSVEGLARRDQRLFDFAWDNKIPIAVTMAGGYGKVIEETAMIHAQTVALAAQHEARIRGHEPPD